MGVVICYYITKNTENDSLLTIGMLVYGIGFPFSCLVCSISLTAGETFETYIKLSRIFKANPERSISDARLIVSRNKSMYCNRRGAKLFLKDHE